MQNLDTLFKYLYTYMYLLSPTHSVEEEEDGSVNVKCKERG